MQEEDNRVRGREKQYQFIRRLGKGGGGTTYLVKDLMLEKEWALKVCRTSAGIPGNLQREAGNLRREAGLLAGLSHRNIVSVIDYWRTEEAEYLLMEYLRGETLEQRIRRHGKIEERQAVKWIQELALMFTYLHRLENPVYYLDCKPSNIMVLEDGHLKLFDFGAAVRADEAEKSGNLQETGSKTESIEKQKKAAYRKGTYGYASYEYMTGGEIDGSCDIYSLGMTLYAMVTGYLPQLPPYGMRPVEEWKALVTPECARVILYCTAKERKQRCGSAEALLRELERIKESGCGDEREHTAGENTVRKRRLCRRRTIMVIQKKSIFYTKKRYAGLLVIGFILLLAYQYSVQGMNIEKQDIRAPQPLLVAVKNENGQKVLIKDNTNYTITGPLRLEIPREYLWQNSAITITITPRDGGGKREKTLLITVP